MTSNFIILPPAADGRGRPRKYFPDRAASSTELSQFQRAANPEASRERSTKQRMVKRKQRLTHIAVLDFETDPFDPNTQSPVYPFTACLYSPELGSIIIWENDLETFIDKLIATLDWIREPHTIFAHNGGKFDYMFLVHRLRGRVSFKGRSLMAAEIGIHSLRDSSHILPMKLSDWKKDTFDYQKMRRDKRDEYKNEIIQYLKNDCTSLYEIVHAFISEFGFRLTIGQAAMAELKKTYKVEHLGEHTDAEIRQFFYGGRVECLAGAGHFVGGPNGQYKLYDVNSMYPHAMAAYQHPIGKNYTWRRRGGVTSKTAFLEIECDNYRPGGIGGLVGRRINSGGQWETSATIEHGKFFTTIWEYNAALELGLIGNIEIHRYVDCDRFTDFSQYIVPMYERRQTTKTLMQNIRGGKKESDVPAELLESPEYLTIKKEDIFIKFLLNNSFGKFAINPRRFRDYEFTDHDAMRPEGFDAIVPDYRCAQYDIWSRPAPRKTFNNVGTAASITGAARSILMRAIANAVDPIYCDTDSLICRSISGIEIDETKLGAWKHEASFDEVAIAGKKLYACLTRGIDGQKDKIKVRSKGVREGAIGWSEILRILDDEVLSVTASLAPVFSVRSPGKASTPQLQAQEQSYITRSIRRTADRKVA